MKLQSIPSPTTQSILEALDELYERRVAIDELISSLEYYQLASDESERSRADRSLRRSERRLAS